jgi:signal transduction histidine kinase
VHPDDLPGALSRWADALASGSPYEAEFRLRAADGQYRWHIARALPERDMAGAVVGWVGSNTDVEAERRARADAEAARTAAEAANRAKSELLSTMSHELRTPLNAIGGYAELLTMGLRGPVTPEQREDLERIRRANQHLLSLINDILNFARIEAGRLEFHPVDLEIGPVIADVEALVRPQLAAKGIAFDHDGCAPDTPDRPHVVRADPERLRQVLLNLITNAIKFTDAGGRVSLLCDADAAAGITRIRVRDTGRGIAQSQLAVIFEPFVQVDRYSSPGSQQGVGLGLAISRELARGMDGDLTVESEVGVGSTFTLSLPRPAPR